MQLKKQQLEPDMEQWTGSKLRKEYIKYIKAVYCHPVRWAIKIAERKINNLRYKDDTTFMAESEEELKRLSKVKEESEKAGLKLNIQKTKTVASGPNHFMANRRGNNGNSDRVYFLGL